MRSSGGTKFGPPVSVVALTKSTMACFAGPSFHEGSGSWAWVLVKPARVIASRAKVLRMIFMGLVADTTFSRCCHAVSAAFGGYCADSADLLFAGAVAGF